MQLIWVATFNKVLKNTDYHTSYTLGIYCCITTIINFFNYALHLSNSRLYLDMVANKWPVRMRNSLGVHSLAEMA